MDDYTVPDNGSLFKSLIKNNSTSTEAKGNFDFMYYLVRTKLGLATLVFVTTIIISLASEPPFLLIKNADPIKTDEISYMRAILMSGFLASAVYFIPLVATKPVSIGRE